MLKVTLLVSLSTLLFTGCTSLSKPTITAGGAGTGAAIGHKTGGTTGAAVGGAVGAGVASSLENNRHN